MHVDRAGLLDLFPESMSFGSLAFTKYLTALQSKFPDTIIDHSSHSEVIEIQEREIPVIQVDTVVAAIDDIPFRTIWNGVYSMAFKLDAVFIVPTGVDETKFENLWRKHQWLELLGLATTKGRTHEFLRMGYGTMPRISEDELAHYKYAKEQGFYFFLTR